MTGIRSAAEGCHLDGSAAVASPLPILIPGKDGEHPNLLETNRKCKSLQRIELLTGEIAPCVYFRCWIFNLFSLLFCLLISGYLFFNRPGQTSSLQKPSRLVDEVIDRKNELTLNVGD